MPDIILIHSPLVGPSSLRPTADALERMGIHCHLPTPARLGDEIPAWRDWPSLLLDELPRTQDVIVVGHSAGALLAAHVAASRNARALVCLDAAMPPQAGLTPPAEPWFYKFLHTLPVSNGRLPRWNQWWGADVLATTSLGADLKAAFVDELPELRLDWFDDGFEMPNWSQCERYFIRTSKVFDEEANRAESLGWTVSRLNGTHLHPTLEPDETAGELFKIAQAVWVS
jgi:pimeloyl-ACP methyl ester carboxylesterase